MRVTVGSLAPFLPPHLVRRLATSGPLPRLPRVERFPAALLFSDISGFTALTERLQARGREGAEEIAAAVNAAFAPAIRAIEREGGSIVSFGGDALFAIFPGASPVYRAHAAADAIREAFAAGGGITTSAGPVRLGISQAIHHGEVMGLHLGTAGRRHYLVAGPAVAALARLETRASGGKLLLSPEARRRLKREPATPHARPLAARASGAVLRPYLEPRLLPLLARFEGEYRRAGVLFLETKAGRPAALQSFYLALVEALGRTEGVLLKTDLSPAGTKWLCVFGIPLAHEEDPDRAARAAIEVIGRVPSGLAVRGGLHAGVVANIVVGTRSRRSFDVMGDAVNTAARALAHARWTEVLVPEETRKVLAGVETTPRGKRTVKGKAAPLALHALTAVRAMVRQIRVSAPMTGRDQELRQIVEALERARAGRGSVIGIKGDPGIGKSRLKYEAGKVAREMGFEVHEGRAISFGGMAHWTIGGMLKDILALPEIPSKGAILAKVTEATDALGLKPVDRHHLAEILGARYPDSPINHLQGQEIRLNAMVAARALCRTLARQKPRLLVLEDMHWADGASVEAARALAEEALESSYVLLLLYRPGYEPPAAGAEIELQELGAEAVDLLLDANLGMTPADVAALVRERSSGNPFYVEEVIRHLLEAGILCASDEGHRITRAVRPEDLPERIEALVAARLDRLSADVKSTAQHAAVIGRSFLFELLAHLPRVADAAGQSIADLCRRELTFELRREPHLEYVFKHALTRDAAYSSILVTQRRKIHRAVADAIEELLVEEREAFLPVLGHHREMAGQREEAGRCYMAAARRAAASFALDEAERLYRAGLSMTRASSPDHVAARIDLGHLVLRVRGRRRDAEEALLGAAADARRLGSRALEADALRALGFLQASTGDVRAAESSYERAIQLSRQAARRTSEGRALVGLAQLRGNQGRVDEALGLYERAIEILEGEDPGGECALFTNLAGLLISQGRVGEAGARLERGLALARTHGFRDHEGVCLTNLALLRHQTGHLDEAGTLYHQALTVHREIGNRTAEGETLGMIAVLRYRSGATAEALAHLEEALAIQRETRHARGEGIVLGNLALMYIASGRLLDARSLLSRAVTIQHELGNRSSEGILLANLASLELFVSGDTAVASTLLDRAEAHLVAVGERGELAILNCHRGHFELTMGSSSRGYLKRARQLVAEVQAGPGSEAFESVSRLSRASRAFEGGEPLVCGFCPDQLPAGQLCWLRVHRPEVIPPEVMARLNENGTLRPEEPPSKGKPTTPAAEL